MKDPPVQGPAPRASSNRVPALDGIRAYAILGVVAVHLIGASGVFARTEGTDLGVLIWGALGNTIDAFFIISAFVLFLPAVRRGGDLGSAVDFWIRRGARLLPAFWLVLVLVLFLAAIHPPLPDYHFPALSEIAANAALLQMPARFVSATFPIGFGIDGPMWIISIVVTFYAILPLISRPWYRYPLIALGLAAVLTLGWKELVGRSPELLLPFTNGDENLIRVIGVDQFPGWAFSFGLGMTGAWAYVRSHERWSTKQLTRFSVLTFPLALLLFIAAGYLRGRHALTVGGNVAQVARSHPFEMLFESATKAVLMAVVVLGPAWMQAPFVNRPTARLAELSYGVYLIHFVLILYAADLLDLPNDGTLGDLLLWTAVVVPVSLLFAAVSRRYFELPILNRVRLWLTRRDSG